ncbi:Ser/Thr protein phosphatase, putative [Trichomonas vaginalis G3]|uniref:Serine/threonine-protein phosphatase n=1 Tax=Trichomonas vaginalis (strain ATCC PRA-98 / G3) TaxID=412133 RepID=A2DDG3_TRIV3|nr:phosphoprotein phosphatase protein [Trichomonas vaginalis G3]EAY21642.1 Ser/Thr protein phosphatase, putative [Trichomonas vaginalis G3]KAI5489682.1 phosphoprotein phosphatase protein [Trichomonas vaginalis G3]|eukprot:XP_001582628.1 Ser/Thr protein phosphatase [Trichomonas vaginalis G3]
MNTTLLDSFIVSVISSRANAMCRKGSIYQMKFDKYFVTDLLDNVSVVLDKEPSLLYLPSDIVVVGDIHGNIDDLIRFFTTCGYPPQTKYLFLGDYVDRGANAVEVVLLLFALKLKYPDSIYLLRGNHECESLTTAYGFRTEASNRVDKETYFLFTNTFQYLPYAAVINKEIFCVHGGISQFIHYIDEIQDLKKSLKIPSAGPIADLLWSDPRDRVEEYHPSDRKVGYFYGWKAVNNFMKDNKLKLIVRSHEACDDGYKWAFKNVASAKGKCLTIFSNSDYSQDSNSACVLKIDKDNNYEIIHFERHHCGPLAYPTWLPQNNTEQVAFRMIKKSKDDNGSYESFDDFFDEFYNSNDDDDDNNKEEDDENEEI